MMASDGMLYLRTILALVFVVGLIFLLAAVVKKAGLDKRLIGNKTAVSRLSIIETLYLDQRHRVVIVRRDKKEHVILIGAAGDMLIESYEKEDSHAVS